MFDTRRAWRTSGSSTAREDEQQLGFVSQVTSGVTLDGKTDSNDLAFTPKPFLALGPEVRF